jgi:hypothetical protein
MMPTSEVVWCGARREHPVTAAAHALVRPAMRWMHVVSSASASGIAGMRVVSRRASIEVPSR